MNKLNHSGNDRIRGAMTARRSALGLILASCFVGQVALADPIAEAQAEDGNQGVVISTTGGGHYLIGGAIDVKFSFSAKQKENGFATGQFRQSVVFNGELIDFHGEVTCLAVDSENGRAWIGGIVTQNNSEAPAFMTEIHEPGRDVWFRVLDNGEGQADPDRSTFLGFEGAADIITSEEYCAAQIWPDGDARTSPVVQGNIQVRP